MAVGAEEAAEAAAAIVDGASPCMIKVTQSKKKALRRVAVAVAAHADEVLTKPML